MSSVLPETSARREPENLAILLREPFRISEDLLQSRLAERGHPEVRAPHGNVFQFLDDAGTRVSVLAQRAQVTKQSMAELVAHLERHGYVARVPDPSDGRAKLVRATARGGEVFAIAHEFVRDIEREWAEAMGEQKLRRLRVLLEELNAVVARQAAEA